MESLGTLSRGECERAESARLIDEAIDSVSRYMMCRVLSCYSWRPACRFLCSMPLATHHSLTRHSLDCDLIRVMS
jgi:hypothetical protein